MTTLSERVGLRAHPSDSAPTAGRRPRFIVAALGALVAVVGGGFALGFGPTTAAGGPLRIRSNVPVTPSNFYERPSQNSPELAIDPTDSRFVAAAYRVDAPFSCGLEVSGDSGRSWVTAEPIKDLPAGVESCYGPEIAFDRHGTLYFLFVGLAGPGNAPIGVYLTKSTDKARHFSAPAKLYGPEHYAVRMAIDPTLGPYGRIHLVWIAALQQPPLGGFAASPNPVMSAYSDDGGKTFSTEVQVSDASRARVVAPAIAVGAHHDLHVLYYDLGADARDYQGLDGPPWDGAWSLVLATSADGGNHFGTGRIVDADLLPPERVMLIFTMPPPAIAADTAGNIYVGWHDARNGDWDVFVRHSPDSGQNWGPARRVNDDPVHDGSHQYQPHLSLAPNGRLDVVFYDRRNNSENRGNDVFYAFSKDRGATFSRNRQLTELDSDSTVGPQYAVRSAQGMIEFGGRTAVASANAKVLAAWTDARYTSRFAPAQDVFAGEVDYPTHHGLPTAARAIAALLAAVGAALVLANRPRKERPKGVATRKEQA